MSKTHPLGNFISRQHKVLFQDPSIEWGSRVEPLSLFETPTKQLHLGEVGGSEFLLPIPHTVDLITQMLLSSGVPGQAVQSEEESERGL